MMGAAVLAAGLVMTSSAYAQPSALPEPNTFEITPFIGFGLGFGESPALSDGAFMLGVAGAYNFTTQLAVEGELGIIPDIAGETNTADISVQTFSANGVYHFDTRTAIVPYATFGLGFGRMHVELVEIRDPPLETSSEFAVNFGGGVKYPINDRLAVRGDLRYFNINDENPNFWRIYGGATFRLGSR
jgi:OmpA-OmpF porin, OOP family